MRTIETILYSFNELSEQAKQKAIEEFLNSEREYFWMDDNLESLKQGLKHFGFELSDWSIDYYCATRAYLKITSNYEYDVNELSGVRLFKYIQNNRLPIWNKYTNKYVNVLEQFCPFTGYCVDENFLDPIRKFMEQPTNISFMDLMEECANEVMKAIENDYEYQNSEEFAIEEMINNDWEFNEDGTKY